MSLLMGLWVAIIDERNAVMATTDSYRCRVFHRRTGAGRSNLHISVKSDKNKAISRCVGFPGISDFEVCR